MIRTDNTAPFIQLNTQGDILELDAGASRQPDNTYLRTWELTGASHIDAHEATYELETIAREEPTTPVPACALGTPIEGTGHAARRRQPGEQHAAVRGRGRRADRAEQVAHDRRGGRRTARRSPRRRSCSACSTFRTPTSTASAAAASGCPRPSPDRGLRRRSTSRRSRRRRLNPISLLSELEAALASFQTGSITDPTLRSAGLCLLSGYFTDLGNSALTALYPTTADVRREVHGRGERRRGRRIHDPGGRGGGDRQRQRRHRSAPEATADGAVIPGREAGPQVSPQCARPFPPGMRA